ncbi:hypothetical protein GCM10010923_17550 [Blastomonas marina]|uniref:Cell division protein ZipA n=1 Tax=Blastomonas marina TaxID=1867408 RepID=A0ABQ1FF93_9SPHN|nr:hypothetical protein [Blastomonas marina]GGA07935.1 hypothetical protein GCM10010923_17550 [Blastomonas marina]
MSELLALVVIAIVAIWLFRRVTAGSSSRNAAPPRSSFEIERDEAIERLFEGMQPLVRHAEALNRRLRDLLERDLQGNIPDLKREKLESELGRIFDDELAQPNSMHLWLRRIGESGPVFEFSDTASRSFHDRFMGPVDHDDTEKWEKTVAYAVLRWDIQGDYYTGMALLDLDAAKTLLDRLMWLHVEQMPFGYTPEMLGVEPGSVQDLIAENKAYPQVGPYFKR